MEIYHIFISGFVQGVGFRQFVKRNALKLGLTGWVKNLPDNRVEIILQGSKEQIDREILLCKKGPFLSEVKNIEMNLENAKIVYKSFDIIS